MTTFQFRVTIGENGSIVILSTPLPVGEEFEFVLKTPSTETTPVDPTRILPNGKTAVDDFIDFFTNRPTSDITDEEIEQAKYDYLMEKYG